MDELEIGAGFQSFKLAFNSRATALVSHAEMEEKIMTAPVAERQPPGPGESATSPSLGGAADPEERVAAAMAALEDELHAELVDTVQGVLTLLLRCA